MKKSTLSREEVIRHFEMEILWLVRTIVKAKEGTAAKPTIDYQSHVSETLSAYAMNHGVVVEHAKGASVIDALLRLEIRLRLQLNAALAMHDVETTNRPLRARVEARLDEALRLNAARYEVF